MSSDSISAEEAIQHCISGKQLLDVRSESEFARSQIPNSLCSPLLRNEERKQVGICYKQEGQAAAIELGERLVAGSTKSSRIESWRSWAKTEKSPVLFCARGGLRSKISQQWLRESGVETLRVNGGHKLLRRKLLSALDEIPATLNLRVISGTTGSRKTELLWNLSSSKRAVIDLEELAKHRGSAFGKRSEPQPEQASFENALATELLKQSPDKLVFIEDESRSIGLNVLPEKVFSALCSSPVVLLRASLADRAQFIRELYIDSYEGNSQELLAPYLHNLKRIERSLGGLRHSTAERLMKSAFETKDSAAHEEWIRYLLENYYDPYYERHIERNRERIVFEGNYDEVMQYCLAAQQNNCIAQQH